VTVDPAELVVVTRYVVDHVVTTDGSAVTTCVDTTMVVGMNVTTVEDSSLTIVDWIVVAILLVTGIVVTVGLIEVVVLVSREVVLDVVVSVIVGVNVVELEVGLVTGLDVEDV